jgi:formate C-acetyltransferase
VIADEDRLGALRERCLDRKRHAWRDISIPRAAALRQSEHVASWQERQGLCTREVLRSATFVIDDLELLAGRLAPRQAGTTDEALAHARVFLKQYPSASGQTGHCELDLSLAMELGVDGLREDIEARLKSVDGESAVTYRSFLLALEGLAVFIQRAAETALSQMAASIPERRAELDQIAEICRWIAHKPPRSFRDAIQLQWLIILAVQYGESIGLVGPGHLDRTLNAFYKDDIAAGRLTREEALRLIESLYLLVNEFVPDGLAIPVMVGGRDADGNDVTNDLSHLCLEALRRTKLVYPTVGVCWHEGTPRELVNLAINLISKGYSTPAFFGDETIQRGLKGYGVPDGEACNYINSTCVEITPVGSSNVWVASPYYNMCATLLEEIEETTERQPVSFDEFMNGYLTRLAAEVESGVVLQNKTRQEREQWGRKPLQSVFTRDCVERGKDIDCGGAVYNWVECSFVGLANFADSMFVIKKEVFDSERMSLRELQEILAQNYECHEGVRQRFMNAYPKYGQDSPDVDAFLPKIAGGLTGMCGQFKMCPDDSPYVPGAFVWVMHEQLGKETGATPDGRKAGVPFADGAGPAQGRECKGPTAAILSTTSWDQSPFIGGVAFNMKFNASLFSGSPEAADALRDLILSYLRRGGFETQVNVVDRELLCKAREHPEAYRDLVVRIGGYTDYFTRLSTQMQDEVMMRTEYGSD